ncbi:uncharacterized protein LOC114361810 [Ostrinia furnacalis]|uniref:uncharacterized protein LOC114361810 n=1 Tax=Ostrinia furnacalis TaxID=93504 RepID=UPI00103C78C7|nr:uncharacterized protein LOC114361810 [Ostrinia furnacalis]
MDFLDSIELKSKDRKSKRVRSWYLYEQFKSLERNQLDAAQKLKNKSYQDRILRQELSERRERRKLYDQYGVCHSESRITKSASEGNKTSLSASTDDFFETFCELQEDERSSEAEHETDTEDVYSQDDSQTGKRYLDEFKSLENIKDDQSFTDSVNSVVQNYKCCENFTEDLREELELVKKSIAEEITQQFETVKENIECLEKYSKLCSEDKISDAESSESVDACACDLNKSLRHNRESDINLYNIWSKLVSFAYQVIQLNHGNCYYDYSSQFLTAVLACDVIRRGVSRMCHILQPYVSPIKFATDESDASTVSHKKKSSKNVSNSKKSRKPTQTQKRTKCQRSYKTRSYNKYFSDDYWRNLSKHSFGFRRRVATRATEPWRSIAKFPSCRSCELSEKSSCSIWPSFSKTNLSDECACHLKVANPMLKIGQYIDKLLNDIDDCKRL